ncbi:MAG TPA: FtsX-like permease family protein [Terriglobales bacterium]|nr:FtsX-like permease family protein [Terriglobales bacterium]
MAQSVAQRRREIGIRVALGATRSNVAREVLGAGLSMSVVGLAAGMLAALVLNRVLASAVSGDLYSTTALDPVAYLAAPLLLLLVATLACALPARRAATSNPVTALRLE